MSEGSAPSRSMTVLGALALLATLVLLAWPAPRSASALTWDTLVAPLAPGAEITEGYRLAPGHRGAENDVIFVARRPASPGRESSSVEIHVLDRGQWPDVIETESFSIGYELGRSRGADKQELAAVTQTLADAIASNDPGELGPVDSIPFASEDAAPLLVRVLARCNGARAWAIALLLVALSLTLARVDRRGLVLGLGLTSLALCLRASSLDTPFIHDQDVQRALYGAIPLGDHLRGVSLDDRHPPVYFILLHFVERLGQSEALLRAPAVVFGASLPALLLYVAGRGRERIDDFAALAGLLLATAPPLIAKSREVSELPLFAGILLLMTATALWASQHERPPLGLVLAVAGLHGLALWTYYLAPVAILFEIGALALCSTLRRGVLIPIGVGVAIGSPAVFFAARIFLVDRGARAAAAANPELAWGEWGPLSMGGAMLDVAVACVGSLVLLFVLGALVVAIQTRTKEALVFAAVGLGVALGMALLSTVARIQPYYLLCVIPLLALIPRALDELEEGYRGLASGGFALAVLAQLVTVLPGLQPLYQPSREAFVAAFAPLIDERPEQLVITVSHYDATLLAYYLARERGLHLTPGMFHDEDRHLHVEGLEREIWSLVPSHEGLEPGFEDRAAGALGDETWRSVLVISRRDFHIEAVAGFLSHCELMRDEAGGQLHRCGPPPGESPRERPRNRD